MVSMTEAYGEPMLTTPAALAALLPDPDCDALQRAFPLTDEDRLVYDETNHRLVGHFDEKNRYPWVRLPETQIMWCNYLDAAIKRLSPYQA